MEFVDHDDPHIPEELVMIDLLGNQHDLQRFGRRQQAIGLLCEDSLPFTLRGVAVPQGSLPPHQPQVLVEALLLIVQQRLDRADVQDRDARPGFFEHLGDDREKRRLGFAASRGCQNDEVGTAQIRFDGQRLHFPQIPPAQRVHDVVLQCGM